MTDFPDVKIKALVSFPATVLGGTGIDVVKQNGALTVDLDYSEFGLVSSIPISPTNYILTYDTQTATYIMVPSHLLGGGVAGIADAPVDGTMYGRISGSWDKVLPLTGGTLTGSLAVKTANPSVSLNKAASGQNNTIAGYTNNSPRWTVQPGNATAESGSNAGSDFEIDRFSDTGSVLGTPLSINRATGTTTLTGTTGQAALVVNDLAATAAYNSVYIKRTEALPLGVDTEAAQNAALHVEVTANNTSAPAGAPIAQPVGIYSQVVQTGTGDAVAFYGSTVNLSPGYAAFGAFFNTQGHYGAIGLGLGVTNDGPNSYTFSGSGPWYFVGVDIPYSDSTNSGHNGEAGILFRAAGGKWDTLVGVATGSVANYYWKSDNLIIDANGNFTTQGRYSSLLGSGSAGAQFDISSAPGIVIAQGGHAQITGSGAGLLTVVEYTAAGDTALYLLANNIPVMVSSVTGLFQATSTTTPAAGKLSIAAVGAAMHVYNNRGTSVTVKAMFSRLA